MSSMASTKMHEGTPKSWMEIAASTGNTYSLDMTEYSANSRELLKPMYSEPTYLLPTRAPVHETETRKSAAVCPGTVCTLPRNPRN